MDKNIIIFSKKEGNMGFNELKQHGTDDFPIELYRIDSSHPKYEMVFHWHTSIEIIRILEGTLAIKLNNKEYPAGTGDIVFVNSETLHGAAPKDCRYECIVFHPDIFSSQAKECRDFTDALLNHTLYINEFFPASDTPLHRTVNMLFNTMRTSPDGGSFIVIGLLYQLFGIIRANRLYSEMLPTYPMRDEKNVRKIKKAVAFIRESYASPVTLGDIAASAGMSPKYFCTFFREMTRQSPVEYLNTYRIERACRALLNTDSSVTDIAYSCGFNDLSYFIKTFKAIKGVTPKVFRKK